MTGEQIVTVALERGVVLDLSTDGRLVARGPTQRIAEVAPLVKENRLAVLSALKARHEVLTFAPPDEPGSDREALEERAGIIAEGCGLGPEAARREACWEAERERTWRAFLRNASKILEVVDGERQGLLEEYGVEARARYGEPTGTYMAETMRRWIAARTTENS